jgi:hypothetical protein
VVYVAINRGFPDLVKVGSCSGKSADRRLSVLSNNSGVPYPYECRYAALVHDYKKVESRIHKIFKELRVNPAREFFKVSPESVIELLQLIDHEDVTSGQVYAMNAEDRQALENEERRQLQSGKDPEKEDIESRRINCVIAAINERKSPGAFQDVFLGENCWRSLSMSKAFRDAVKWFALYQILPLRQVTHIAKVGEIVKSKKEPGKWQLNFDGSPKPLQRPIPHGKSGAPLLRSRRYCNKDDLLAAPSLTALFAHGE